MKNIGFIIGEFGKGGQERQLQYLISEFEKSGFNIFLIVWSYRVEMAADLERYTSMNVKVLLLEQCNIVKKIISAREFIISHNCRSLQCFSFYLNFYTFLITLNSSVVPIGGIRSQLNLMIVNSGYIKFLLCSFFPTKKISNNHHFKNGIDSLICLLYRNTEIVINQLDVGSFVDHKQDYSNTITTCSLSRLYPEKNIDMIIDLISMLKTDGFQVMHFHAGKGPLLEDLNKRVKEKNLENNFFFVGELSDVNEFLLDKHIFLHCSTSEGFPNVIMESMACGKPVITTKCGDVELLIDDGDNGFIVDNGDLNLFYLRLKYLFLNKDIIYQMARKSRKKALIKFNLSRLRDDTLCAYHKFNIRF